MRDIPAELKQKILSILKIKINSVATFEKYFKEIRSFSSDVTQILDYILLKFNGLILSSTPETRVLILHRSLLLFAILPQEEPKHPAFILCFLHQIVVHFDMLILKQATVSQVDVLDKLLGKSSSYWAGILIRSNQYRVEYENWKTRMLAMIIEKCPYPVVDELCAKYEDRSTEASFYRRDPCLFFHDSNQIEAVQQELPRLE